MWVEKEGAMVMQNVVLNYGVNKLKGPGESRSDLWQIVEFSKYFKTDEVWGEELLAQMPEYRGKTLYGSTFTKMVK